MACKDWDLWCVTRLRAYLTTRLCWRKTGQKNCLGQLVLHFSISRRETLNWRSAEPWTGTTSADRRFFPPLICARVLGGVTKFMSRDYLQPYSWEHWFIEKQSCQLPDTQFSIAQQVYVMHVDRIWTHYSRTFLISQVWQFECLSTSFYLGAFMQHNSQLHWWVPSI